MPERRALFRGRRTYQQVARRVLDSRAPHMSSDGRHFPTACGLFAVTLTIDTEPRPAVAYACRAYPFVVTDVYCSAARRLERDAQATRVVGFALSPFAI